MPARAHALWQMLDEFGNRVPAMTVTVREPGTTTAITDTIYVNDDPDASVYPNPFTTDANGIASFFLAKGRRVDLHFAKTGYTSVTVPNVDVTFPANRFTHRGAYSAVTTYNQDDVVSNAGSSWVAKRTVTGVTPVEGADWTLMASAATGGISPTIVDAKGDLIVATAADTVARKAIGAEGTVPVSRAAETTGIAWETLPTTTTADVQEFSASGTWTKPAGAKLVLVEIWGGGAGGANGPSVASGTFAAGAAAGGGGQMRRTTINPTNLGATESVTIGAGGTAGGGAGGTSSFGSHLSARGAPGQGGAGEGTAVAVPIGIEGALAPGTAAPGNSAEWGGGSGAAGGERTTSPAPAGGSSTYGGAGGGGGGGKDTGAGSGKAGGTGGSRGRTAGGGAAGGAAEGGAGTAGSFLQGGGGGAGHATGTAGAGGTGGAGSGGGGGGAGVTGGAGGVGGTGFCRVTTFK